MAIKVGYFANTDQCYGEGPFVYVFARDFRIECGMVGTTCPILPDMTVVQLLRSNGYPTRTHDEEWIKETVDWLNAKFREGIIKLVDGAFITV